jgi:hypothetical protein
MGYEKYLGASLEKTGHRLTVPIAAERFYNTDFGGEEKRYSSLALHKQIEDFAYYKPYENSIEVSEFVDPDEKRICPAILLYENELGGRIALYPFDINQTGKEFCNPGRQKQYYSILKWLSKDKLPLFTNTPYMALPFRHDSMDNIVIGAFCLSLDGWKRFEAEAYIGEEKIKSAKVLTDNGEWIPFNNYKIKAGVLKLKYDKPVDWKVPFMCSFEI